MLHSLLKLTGRAVLTVVLVLATQLTYAGQLCHSIASWNTAVGGHARLGYSSESPCPVVTPQPCCDAGMLQTRTCLTAPADLDAAMPMPAPVPDLAPPAPVWHLVANPGTPSVRLHFPAAAVGLSPPPYILFSRFLS